MTTDLRPRGDGRDSRPIVALFVGSAVAGVVVAVVSVAALASTVDVARVRELDLFRMARLFLEERGGMNPLAALPSVFSMPFELGATGELLRFTALAIGATVLLFWAVAAALAPVVLAVSRMYPSGTSWLASWVWQRAYPLTVLVGFVSPAIKTAVREALSAASQPTIWVLTMSLTLAVWLVLLWTLRDPRRVRRFMWASGLSGAIVTAIVWSAGALYATREAGPMAKPPPAPGLPNILLVSIDSLRRDHLHCYGYARETSPSIDRLAREGALFRTVVSPTSWTLPAHLTMLTSLPPEAHGVVDDGMRLQHNVLFLAEVLQQAGYATNGFVSAPYLDAAYGFAQGFDSYDDYTVAKASQVSSHQGTTSPTLVHLVAQYLDRWNADGRGRPFFVFMHMWDVHYDYTPPPPYDSMFDPDYKGTITAENYEYGTQVHNGMDPRDLEHIIALYDGEIRFTDLYLGKVLDRLAALGVLDDTLIVVTADHGDEFFEHGNKSHSKALYDETVLVPLVIRFPRRVSEGRSIDGQVRLMDIAPTILSLAGLRRPVGFGGSAEDALAAQDLSSWITPDAERPAPGLIAFGDLETAYAPRRIASVRTNNYKLIEPLGRQGGDEIYDLKEDPGEQQNIVAQNPPVDGPLRQQLATWRGTWHEIGGLAQKIELSEEHKERLRALGYMR